jgi:HEAT repeat protein
MGRAFVVILLIAGLSVSVLARDPPRPRYKDRTAPEWARDLTSEDVKLRRNAVYALWTLAFREKGLGPILARAVRDDDEYVRQTAAAAITRLGTQATAAVPGLVDALSDDSADVRREAMLLIYRIRFLAGTALRPIVKALDDEDPVVRANAAGVIEFQGAAAKDLATEPLVRHLTDEDQKVRLWSARALAKVNPPALVKPALARAKEGSPEQRAEAFGQLGYARLAAKEAVPTLVEALEEENPSVREAAVKALGVIDPTGTVDPVAKRLTDEDAKVRRAAAEALGYATQSAKAYAEAVAKLLSDPDVEVRRAAITALPVLGPDLPAAPILAALDDPDEAVRLATLTCLTVLGAKARPAVPRLRILLASESMPMRTGAIRALSGIGESAAAAAPDLVAILNDPQKDEGTRSAAVRALGTLGRGSPEAINAVIRALDDPDPNMKYAAIDAVAALGPEAVAARGRLATMLEEDVGAAYLAAQALGRIGEGARRARPALRRMMAGPNASGRAAAALAIWRIERENAKDAIEAFRTALGDQSLRTTAVYLAQQEEDLIRALLPDLLAVIEKDPTFAVTVGSSVATHGTAAQRDKVVAVLIGFVEDPPEQEFLVANALSQLGNIGPPAKAAIPALESYVKREGATYAPTAQWALDRIREKKPGE